MTTEFKLPLQVKRSEEAHILKALRLEDMVGSLQSDLSRVQREALEANAQVTELKAKLAESEQSRETLSSRFTETIRELAEARYEVKELKAKLDKVTQEYTAARIECEISAAAAKEASERSKAVIEALQRRVHLPGTDVGLGTKEGLVQELETLQKKVHEQDEFASILSELHVQVEKTRLEIKTRLDEASEKASAMGLGKHMDGTFGKGISTSLPAVETENSSIACKSGNDSPHVKMGDEDRYSADFCGSQESPSRQESDLLALSTRSSSLGFQPENSNENTAEKVSALTISEAAKPLVGVKSQIETLCPVGVPPGNPAFHGCDANDAGLGCTQAPSWRSEAQVRPRGSFWYRVNSWFRQLLTLLSSWAESCTKEDQGARSRSKKKT
jgi:hypothetical protein